MSYYVGCITEPANLAAQETLDGRIEAVGRDMDNGRKVKFWATAEQLSAYFADDDEDAHIVVEDDNVISVTGRYGRDLWTNAGLPWSIG
jgi:hypothetical protein